MNFLGFDLDGVQPFAELSALPLRVVQKTDKVVPVLGVKVAGIDHVLASDHEPVEVVIEIVHDRMSFFCHDIALVPTGSRYSGPATCVSIVRRKF